MVGIERESRGSHRGSGPICLGLFERLNEELPPSTAKVLEGPRSFGFWPGDLAGVNGCLLARSAAAESDSGVRFRDACRNIISEHCDLQSFGSFLGECLPGYNQWLSAMV